MRICILIPFIAVCFLAGCENRQTKKESDDAIESTSITAEPTSVNKSDADTVLTGPEPEWANVSDLLPVPDDATGLAYFRRNDVFIHLDKSGQKTFQSQRVKLLDARALDAGNLSLTWNPEAGPPIVHALLIHRGEETRNILDKLEFEVIQREDLLEYAILTGHLTAVLRIPDLRVGDELELSYTIPSHDPTLKENNYGVVSLGGIVQSGRHNVRISWANEHKPTVKLTKDLLEFEQRTRQSVSVALENPEILNPPQHAPLRYNWLRVIEYSDFESWSVISRYFYDLFDDASMLPVNSEVRKEVKRIEETYSDEFERTKSALELVQQQIRYIYVGLGGGNLEPATADETWSRRYGDCKGKVALLLALLRELNINAEAVLVNNAGADDGFNERLPNPGLFDHVVVRAKIDGINYWLDPTLPDVAEPGQQPILPYRWVLPLSSAVATLEPVQIDSYTIPQEMGIVEYDSRAGFDMPARKVWTTVKRGVVGLAEYIQYSAFTAEQLNAALRNSMLGTDGWDSIDDVSYKYDRNSQASILTVTGTGPIQWDNRGNGRYKLSLPGGGFNPPYRRQRAGGGDESAPFYNAPIFSCHVTTVRLPDETNIDNWGFNSTYTTEIFGRLYYRMMERRNDHTIRMVRASRVKKTEITTNDAYRDNARIDDFDNSKASIEYAPSKVMTPWGDLREVPATYEIDWTSSNAPCLP